jgi:hypothetical protein
MTRVFLFSCIFVLSFSSAFTQKENASFQLHIRKTALPIVIDGKMNEQAWLESDAARDFYMVLPMDTSRANAMTEVRMTYNDENLYLIAQCFHAVKGRYFVESLRRDFIFGKNDNFLVFIDPFDDQTNGFSFGANAAGAQWDGTMYSGGSVDLNWDNKWLSQVTYDDEKWTFEMAIPFTTIRYKKDIDKWGINFSRLDLKTTEKSSWAPVPRQFPTAALAYSGTLVWDAPPPSPRLNISLIPYVLGGIRKEYETGNDITYQKKIGADVKVAITSSLNLDLTINPDFSQVEVDRQVTNLDRFELFFPERRQFFLENGDLFSNFGYATIRPFFSRRIGLGVPIRAGARLSGKINKDWRIGIMDMQTASVKSRSLPDQNFAIISMQRRVFARSNIAFLFVNKESVGYKLPDDPSTPVYSRYNRNVGLEYNLASNNNRWTGKAFVLKSFSPGVSTEDFAQAAHLQYSSRKWLLLLQEEYVGENYNAESGYVPRRAYLRVNPIAGRLFFPRRTVVLSHGPKISTSYYFNEARQRTDNLTVVSYSLTFRNQSTFAFGWVDEFVKLLSPFDPTNSGKELLAEGTRHHWQAWKVEYFSKPQSLLTYAFNSRWGSYYSGGSQTTIGGEVGFRFQPFANFNVNVNYNNIQLPYPWNKTVFWLIGSSLDLTMTNKLFFSTFAQYNQQTKNVNLNSRFQWRFQPASDLFIVYTDNYLPETFRVRNRAMVVKLTYWWNRK